MADEKWIAGLRGDMPVSEAAHWTLTVRLGAVRDRLPAAVLHADQDSENVHQLRVSTRRAAAALRLFADCLPDRVYKKTRQSLKALRRSAGEARDWDVFLEMLQSRLARSPVKQRRGLDFLLGFAHGQRVLAQDHLRAAFEAEGEKFAAHIEQVSQTLAGTKPSPEPLSDLAGPMLTKLLHELESAARDDLQNYQSLHQVRILGKQLRYAMEVFESCFVADFHERYYPAIVEMQDILGLANDSFTACQRLGALRSRLLRTQPKQWPHFQDGIEKLLHFHERRLPQQRKKFEKWWREWLTSGAETAFEKMIQAPP